MVQEDHRLSGRGAAHRLGREALRDSGNDPDKLDATWREGSCGSIRGGSNKKNKSCFPPLPFLLLEKCECQISKLPRRPSFEPRICHRWQSCWQVMPYTEAPGIWMNQELKQPSQEPDPNASDILSHPPRVNRRQLSPGWMWGRCDVLIFKCHLCI